MKPVPTTTSKQFKALHRAYYKYHNTRDLHKIPSVLKPITEISKEVDDAVDWFITVFDDFCNYELMFPSILQALEQLEEVLEQFMCRILEEQFCT